MNSDIEAQLDREVHQGELARKAYSYWVMAYISGQQKVLFDEFKNSNFGAYNNIHARINAINELERSILSDIETGEMASKQLKGD